ncbi:hypothetical protein [Furfurilactobacillus curtus]|uniref:Glycosyltransferase RgtA/B/C/D-like domain-containing protein n=1 Tax=Furfurilactobacillus curtus TaxID=1746200 RepID=A0ABQ5JLS5_9LACO
MKKKSDYIAFASCVTMFIIFTILLFYRIGQVPGVFMDEADYINEVISKANFGTDINGLHHSMYFASTWGQGQSAVYSWIVVPFIRLFGFSLFVFRAPFAVLTLLAMLSIVIYTYYAFENKLLATTITLCMVTAPGLFMSGRWVLDANIAPIFITFALLLLILSFNQHKFKKACLLK